MGSRLEAKRLGKCLGFRLLVLSAFVILMPGCETKMNTVTTNASLADLAVSPNSRYIVTWAEDNPPTATNLGGWCMNFACRLYARVYDSTGAPVTGQMLVSPTTNGFYTKIQGAINDTGFFVIVYDQYIYNPNHSYLSNFLYFQRYSPSGVPLFPLQFIDFGADPDVAMTANGDFYVTYHSYPGWPNTNETIYVKKYNSAGNQVLPRITVDTNRVSSSTIRAICTGEFSVAYSVGPSTFSHSTYIQRYNANGTPNGARILVYANPNMSYSGLGETLVYKPDGNLAIVNMQPGTPSGTFAYYIKRFDVNGNPTAPPEFVLNSASEVAIRSMSTNSCGDYALSYVPDGSSDVIVKEYTSNDMPLLSYAVNQGSSNWSPLIGLSSHSYVVAWDRAPYVPGFFPKDTFSVRAPLFAALSPMSHTRVCYNACADCPRTRVIGSPPVAGATYSWSPTMYLSNPHVAQPTVTHPGGSTTTFSITYTVTISTGCCQRTEIVSVDFAPKCPT